MSLFYVATICIFLGLGHLAYKHGLVFKWHFPYVSHSISHFSAPVATRMRKATVGISPPAVTHHCTLLYTVYSIHRGIWRTVVVCRAVCSPRLFLTLGKHPGSGCTQMLGGTMDWNLTGYSTETQGLCMHCPWPFSIAFCSVFNIFHNAVTEGKSTF